jgi:hypothetical protein
MYIDGASLDGPGSGRPRRPHPVRGALAVAAIALAAMAFGPFTAGGLLANPAHLLIFTARAPMIPGTDYHRCARGDTWVACSTPGSHHVVRCVPPRAPHTAHGCGNSDALPARSH